MKAIHEIQNLRIIKVSYLGATNTRGSRIKISETKRYNDDKTESKIFGYNYAIGNVEAQALEILQRNGFNVVCRAFDVDGYILLCNNWGDDFKKVSELK